MVVTARTMDGHIKDVIIEWLTPLDLRYDVGMFDINESTDRNAAYRRSARLDMIDIMWKIRINFDDREEDKMMFLLKFGEYV